ncbi:molybdate ABC transporter substrate-binding protein [Alteromonas sp. a30]|uniref:molybdate ABC transporter substrate-binding protein n=1 Tax=Alteromonas sp. a30 TaxID=2730917 RepID=UPI0022829C13|nr:molybdate ABC transporter substrate-binding protein [Alteromonas sp. a30]MCY7296413.1 molybdate ABC transporter substrate-binding protein [Alteromonas sp. a30]
MAKIAKYSKALVVSFILCCTKVSADINKHPYTAQKPLRLAVAANFKSTLEGLVAEYQSVHPVEITISAASSGVLASQILHGAPFHMFFSADEEKVDWLIKQGKGRYSQIYALGQLVLWAPYSQGEALATYLSDFKHSPNRLAMANPTLAPYGKAAQETLMKLSIHVELTSHIAMANNVSQVAQFVSSGAVKAGFVSASQLPENSQFFPIDASFYQPIKQKVLLIGSQDDEGIQQQSEAFFCYLNSLKARQFIKKNGYALPPYENIKGIDLSSLCGKFTELK